MSEALAQHPVPASGGSIAPLSNPAVSIPTISVGAALPWLIFAALLALVAMYFVGAEQGATSLINGTAVHEWTHDGRHLLGFPATEARMLSARNFLVRGLLAGLVAGIFAFGVAYVVGEPSVNAGIAVEESGAGHDHAVEPAPGASHADETVVPRSLQSTAGLLTATVVAGVTLGGLVGVLSALALGRFGAAGPRATTLAVAAAGFVTLYLIPTVGYPPNPPGVGAGDSIGYRTALYFILTAISVLALIVAVLVGRRLGVRWGGWYATIAAVAVYLLITLTAIALLPTYDAVPSDFPAAVLYDFRRASLITQLALWTVLGVVLADLVGRLSRRAQPTELRRNTVPAGAAQ